MFNIYFWLNKKQKNHRHKTLRKGKNNTNLIRLIVGLCLNIGRINAISPKNQSMQSVFRFHILPLLLFYFDHYEIVRDEIKPVN